MLSFSKKQYSNEKKTSLETLSTLFLNNSFFISCLVKSIFSRWQFFNNIQWYAQFLSLKVLAIKQIIENCEQKYMNKQWHLVHCLLRQNISLSSFYWPIVMVSNKASWSFCHLKFAEFKWAREQQYSSIMLLKID